MNSLAGEFSLVNLLASFQFLVSELASENLSGSLTEFGSDQVGLKK